MPELDTPDTLRATGERIDVLLDASGSGGVVARERAEELVRLVADLYGAGIERILDILFDAGRLGDDELAALAGDDLVSSLLLVHGLHPYSVGQRVEQALDGVRPYLGSHGGDVELLEVTAEGTVRLRLLGSCDGCPSSSVTLKLAVEGAIEAAAPEILAIQVEDVAAEAAAAGLIPVSALRSRLDEVGAGPRSGAGHDPGRDAAQLAGQSAWRTVPSADEPAAGGVTTTVVEDTVVLLCRIGADLFGYLDRCARCGSSMAGAVLSRRLGAAVGEAVLRCPSCASHYDARRAGACLDDPLLHLSPVPLLTTHGTTSVAVATSVSA